ncbi:MAG: hypothetical protein FRX49_01599 [Trebouxia sp. A1-2]|nr:MAG: hypothetical protein FRX49_01599 [Trebouxia sp. A1-2]
MSDTLFIWRSATMFVVHGLGSQLQAQHAVCVLMPTSGGKKLDRKGRRSKRKRSGKAKQAEFEEEEEGDEEVEEVKEVEEDWGKEHGEGGRETSDERGKGQSSKSCALLLLATWFMERRSRPNKEEGVGGGGVDWGEGEGRQGRPAAVALASGSNPWINA